MGVVYTTPKEEFTLFRNYGRTKFRDYLVLFPDLRVGIVYNNDSDVPSYCFYFQDQWLDLLRKVREFDLTKIESPLSGDEIKTGDLGLFQVINFRRWFCKGAEPLRNTIKNHTLEIYEPLETFIRESRIK